MDTFFDFLDGVITFFSRPKPRKRPGRPTRRVVRKTNVTFSSPQNRDETRNRSSHGESPADVFPQPELCCPPDSYPALPPVPSAATPPPAALRSAGPRRHRDQARIQRRQRLQRTVTVLGLGDVPADNGVDICPSADNPQTELAKLGGQLTDEGRVRADELQRRIVGRDATKELQRQRSLVVRVTAWAENCRKSREAPASASVVPVAPPVVLFSAAMRERAEQARLEHVREKAERDRLDRAQKLEQHTLQEPTEKAKAKADFEPYRNEPFGNAVGLKRLTPGLPPRSWRYHQDREEAKTRFIEAIADVEARIERFFDQYDAQWAKLREKNVGRRPFMDLLDLPWPVFEENFRVSAEPTISPDLVKQFVFHPLHRSMRYVLNPRERITEQLWRYDSKNFEATVMRCVAPGSEDRARKAAAEVFRILMDLFCKTPGGWRAVHQSWAAVYLPC